MPLAVLYNDHGCRVRNKNVTNDGIRKIDRYEEKILLDNTRTIKKINTNYTIFSI